MKLLITLITALCVCSGFHAGAAQKEGQIQTQGEVVASCSSDGHGGYNCYGNPYSPYGRAFMGECYNKIHACTIYNEEVKRAFKSCYMDGENHLTCYFW